MRAVVFDFDGLILDTEGPIFTAVKEAFEAHGCEPLTIEEWGAAIGTVDGLDELALLRERSGLEVDEAAFYATGRARRDELLLAEAVLPGVVRWLDDAQRLGLGVGVASSSSFDWVEGHLSRLGLVDRFTCLSCYGGDGGDLRAKPAPDLYLAACKELDVDPGQALAVEDSPHGVAAAKAAGCWCLAVPNALTRDLDLGGADLVAPSLADLSLEEALAVLCR